VVRRLRHRPEACREVDGGFAARSVEDWLDVLGDVLGPDREDCEDHTAVLAVLRGAMLDLLATDDVERTTAAVRRQLALLTGSATC
jgi:hypothetical protein